MKSESSVRIEEKGYNRGLILGFTMAESMLLLVFCLLLVAGAVIASERLKTEDAGAKATVAEADLKQERFEAEKTIRDLNSKIKLLEKLPDELLSPLERDKLDKEWRELVVARAAMAKLKERGISATDVEDLVASVDRLEQEGIDLRNAEKISAELKELAKLRDDVAELGKRKAALEQQKSELDKEKTDLDKREILLAAKFRELTDAAATSKPHEWPPIISLSEAGGYFFKSGSAELTPVFSSKLAGPIGEQIGANLEQYDVDIIEVIGHTDEQPISRMESNFDNTISDVLASRKPITAIIPADNAGLGLARAVAVANVLRSNPRLRTATVIPLSAAQLVMPGDTLTTGQAGDVENRRRIEIRIRRRS